MLGDKGRLSDLHGSSRECDGREYFITYHPASGMRFPRTRRAMRRDFRRLAKRLE